MRINRFTIILPLQVNELPKTCCNAMSGAALNLSWVCLYVCVCLCIAVIAICVSYLYVFVCVFEYLCWNLLQFFVDQAELASLLACVHIYTVYRHWVKYGWKKNFFLIFLCGTLANFCSFSNLRGSGVSLF